MERELFGSFLFFVQEIAGKSLEPPLIWEPAVGRPCSTSFHVIEIRLHASNFRFSSWRRAPIYLEDKCVFDTFLVAEIFLFLSLEEGPTICSISTLSAHHFTTKVLVVVLASLEACILVSILFFQQNTATYIFL